jgi:hypothetical protein
MTMHVVCCFVQMGPLWRPTYRKIRQYVCLPPFAGTAKLVPSINSLLLDSTQLLTERAITFGLYRIYIRVLVYDL